MTAVRSRNESAWLLPNDGSRTELYDPSSLFVTSTIPTTAASSRSCRR